MRTQRRRSKPKTNLSDLAVSGLVANAITEGAFNSNLVDFFTGNRDGEFAAGADGSYRLTLPELIGLGKYGGFGGNYAGDLNFTSVMKKNLKANGVSIATQVVLIPLVAKALTKVLRKPVLNPMNKVIKMTGLDVKV
jgi:hypothetical protein